MRGSWGPVVTEKTESFLAFPENSSPCGEVTQMKPDFLDATVPSYTVDWKKQSDDDFSDLKRFVNVLKSVFWSKLVWPRILCRTASCNDHYRQFPTLPDWLFTVHASFSSFLWAFTSSSSGHAAIFLGDTVVRHLYVFRCVLLSNLLTRKQ